MNTHIHLCIILCTRRKQATRWLHTRIIIIIIIYYSIHIYIYVIQVRGRYYMYIYLPLVAGSANTPRSHRLWRRRTTPASRPDLPEARFLRVPAPTLQRVRFFHIYSFASIYVILMSVCVYATRDCMLFRFSFLSSSHHLSITSFRPNYHVHGI